MRYGHNSAFLPSALLALEDDGFSAEDETPAGKDLLLESPSSCRPTSVLRHRPINNTDIRRDPFTHCWTTAELPTFKTSVEASKPVCYIAFCGDNCKSCMIVNRAHRSKLGMFLRHVVLWNTVSVNPKIPHAHTKCEMHSVEYCLRVSRWVKAEKSGFLHSG